MPVLDAADAAAFVELVAAESGRIGALLAGQLPHSFVEAVEEAGVELLPYGGELGSACSCDAWLDPCPHALAVLTQLAWLIQADPFVLTHLRGLVARAGAARPPPAGPAARRSRRRWTRESPGDSTPSGPDDVDDLVVAEDAAVRAARLLRLDEPVRRLVTGAAGGRPRLRRARALRGPCRAARRASAGRAAGRCAAWS